MARSLSSEKWKSRAPCAPWTRPWIRGEHAMRMSEGAVILGRRVAVALAAALCVSLVVGVLGARAAGAAVQTKSNVTVTVTVSPPTEVYGVLDQVFTVTVAPPSTGDISPTGVVTVSDLQLDLCPPITLPAPGVGAVTVICADSTVAIPVNAVHYRRVFVLG